MRDPNQIRRVWFRRRVHGRAAQGREQRRLVIGARYGPTFRQHQHSERRAHVVQTLRLEAIQSQAIDTRRGWCPYDANTHKRRSWGSSDKKAQLMPASINCGTKSLRLSSSTNEVGLTSPQSLDDPGAGGARDTGPPESPDVCAESPTEDGDTSPRHATSARAPVLARVPAFATLWRCGIGVPHALVRRRTAVHAATDRDEPRPAAVLRRPYRAPGNMP